MNKEYFTHPGSSDVSQVLRNVTTPSVLHTLSRPRRGLEDGDRMLSAEETVKAEELGHDERVVAAEHVAFEKGVAQGRKEVLETEFVQQRKDGYAAGMEAGMAEGRRSGEQLALQVANERLRQFESLLQALPVQLNGLLEQAEDDMVALSMEALYRILGQEVVRPDAIRAMLKILIGDRRAGRKIALHLHPLDYQALKSDSEFCSWLEGEEKHAEWNLVADQEVRLGGVLLNTSEGSLDARLETQLQMLNTVLIKQRTRNLQEQRNDASDAKQKIGGA